MRSVFFGLTALAVGVLACEDQPPPDRPCGPLLSSASRVAHGSATGHPDPMGARAAGQARAGRIDDLALVRRAPDARHRVQAGDYLLANDKLAVYIEAARPSEGYGPYGGEILALETYGADGRPRGASQYGETMVALGGQIVAPERVSVIADGSDGGPAIVRASGTLRALEFIEVLQEIFGERSSFPAALDYVLVPGEARVLLRLRVLNVGPTPYPMQNNAAVGFFHAYRGRTFGEHTGFGSLEGSPSGWAAWIADGSAFAFRMLGGRPMKYVIEIQGFEAFLSGGDPLPACQESALDYAEIIVADDLDGLRETMRRLDGQPASRVVTVTVEDGGGAPLAGALVHATAPAGEYLTRATTGADGRATLHVVGAVRLHATADGREAPPSVDLEATATSAAFAFVEPATIDVAIHEAGSQLPLPARVVVVPAAPPARPPPAFGVPAEAFGRSHQVFTANGAASLRVPAGTHRVIVSRGLEYEIDDRMVTVQAGQTATIDAVLARSVDSTGTMCADFHIHSHYSVDSPDTVELKVTSAIADGLELPVSSEHDYVIDFEPVVEALGLGGWARGFASEELTTFVYGHFGVIPLTPRPAEVNRGAVDWIGKPAAQVFDEVHALPEAPALIVNHPYGTSFQGYFGSTAFDLTTATGDPMLYSDAFEALEVCNNSDVEENRQGPFAAWLALLRRGKRVSAVGNSDSHHVRTTPVGYPRTCLYFGHDEPARVTPEALRDAVKAGDGVVSGGLLLTVRGPGGVRPGGAVSGASAALSFEVSVAAPSWIDADTLEVIVDGRTVQTIDLQPAAGPGPGRRWDAPVELPMPDGPPGHFVVFHAAGRGDLSPVYPGRRAFGLSNPIWF